MATTIQGFGTSFVGQRDFLPDGSYVTTEWVVLLFVPVIPLRSLRVTKTTLEGGTPFYSKQSFIVRQQLPIHAKQVFCVYGFLALYVGLCVLSVAVTPFLREGAAEVVISVTVLVMPWLIPWYIRSRAKRGLKGADINR